MKLVVGLGNPGEQYIGTRHNLGFTFLDKYVAGKLSVEDSEKAWSQEKKFQAEICRLSQDLLLIKPLTFMNNSGQAVSRVAAFFKVIPEDIIVVYDELDLPLGHIKIRLGGGVAGHHGVESVLNHLKTDQFIRLRLGIGNLKSQSGERKKISFNAERFVLDEFTSSEKPKVKSMLKKAFDGLDTLLEKGLESAQNKYH